ncbi:S8 family serine peptidase [Agromyces lapidis]
MAVGFLAAGQIPATALAGEEPDELIGAASASAAAQAVTLINGDRVLVSTAADGTPSAVLPPGRDYYSRLIEGELYVFPADAQPALAADRLDPELFNVTGLIAQGYDDAHSETLPLIVDGTVAQARGASGLTVETELESIGATAVSLDKTGAAAAYAQLIGANARSAGEVKKIWLDAKVQATALELDPATGVEQSGAQAAWNLGFDGTGTSVAVLDTGYDSSHPDLEGRVVATEDFTGEGVEDRAGHGTHVASTVGGSGAADASKTGMAPGADLLVGKVLGRSGGLASWIIDGMEWAVDQGADVVNMSLGSVTATDCTDPISAATEALSRQSNTLFVIAAGNNGLRETVSSPGCAEGALTVGAIDADGATADFSSRGATYENHRIKPDIAAPGVAIIGAQNNSPGGVDYVAMSGTSMASPHVAGAAALVRQAHPDWTAQQVKAALVGAVKSDADGTVYEQGTGELWAPGAIGATITSDVSVELGSFDWPHGRDERATEQVTYTNTSDHAVKLQLKLEDLTGADGESVPSNLVELGSRIVDVPAGGSATVDVTANANAGKLRDGAYGEIGGRIVATGLGSSKGVEVVTAVGFWLEPKTVTVTVKAIDRSGAAATSGYLDLTDMHQPSRAVHYFTGADLELRVRAGSHFLTSFIRTANDDGSFAYAYVGDPDATFDEDTTVTLDARDAEPVTVSGDRPAVIRSGSLGVQRSWDDRWLVGASVFASGDPTLFAAPTDRVRNGTFTFGTTARAYDPAVATEASAYVYNLAFTEEDRVSDDQSHDIGDDRLASVTEHWYAQGKAWAAEEWSRIIPSDGTGPFYSSSGDRVAAPGTRTAYYSPDMPWQQLAQSGGFRTRPEVWFDPIRTYDRGEETETEWFKLATNTAMAVKPDGSPARIAERQGSIVGFSFPQWQDTVEGRVGVPGFFDVGNLELFKNGTSLSQSAFPSGQYDVGTDDAELQLVVNQLRLRRNESWAFGLGTLSTFTFETSRPEGDSIQALPIALPRYDAPVNELNLAPATAEFPVGVTLHGQDGYDPGAIVEFSAQVSYDRIAPNGATAIEDHEWTDVPVVQRDGEWVALVDNTAAADKLVSLRINSEDSHGTKTEQYVLHLYGVE